MKPAAIRQKFLDYFASKDHQIIESSSLIPTDDPSLLFANAGMNQFKDFFTGKKNPPKRRAVSVQKCVRAGGKHNDLENVGFTARHHTFFEMLGNFSFGDYFKNEAIEMAWEFLTKELKIPADKLYITCHESDQESFDIWNKKIGIDKDRIFYMGDKDNFWEMGDTGPCGPCSEIFYDHGPDHSDGNDYGKDLLKDEERYVEIWNLVFMQFEKFKDENGKVQQKNLPNPSVDTGMGLERVAVALNGKYFNYDSDLFLPIINKIEELSKKKYEDKNYTSSMRVISDHVRAASMLISDGAIPSNEGRGYVLRRIIRRGIRHLEELGITKTSLYLLVGKVFEILGDAYPLNKRNQALVIDQLKSEEDKFRKTLSNGLKLIDKEIKNLNKGDSLSGEVVFKLYDTYGFPVDLTETILRDNQLAFNRNEFDQHMAEQKKQSSQNANFQVRETQNIEFVKILEKSGPTKFLGYDQAETQAELLAIVDLGDSKKALAFDQTIFYAEGGGQQGDQGTVNNDIQIVDTQNLADGIYAHMTTSDTSSLKVGQKYTLKYDTQSRELTKRNHSATHLLQAALINVLGDHVQQAGSNVGPNRLRFDFTHNNALTDDQISKIENLVNQEVSKGLPVTPQLTSKEEAIKKGAMALFGEKYGNEVRTITMGEFSYELCGGTHVNNTSEIENFVLLSELSLSSGIRRIEALTSQGAFDYLKNRSKTLKEVETIYSAKDDLLISKITKNQEDQKNLLKKIQKLEDQIQALEAKNVKADIAKLDSGVEFHVLQTKLGAKELKSFSDKYLEQNPKSIFMLISSTDEGKFSFVLRKDPTIKTLLNKFIKDCLKTVNGRGGGKPDLVQGSGELANIDQFKSEIIQNLNQN